MTEPCRHQTVRAQQACDRCSAPTCPECFRLLRADVAHDSWTCDLCCLAWPPSMGAEA
ncbi:hypothetical protein [uncultured Pseudonocardia sp.]|uniref:hypothetical protein n=1 Tax=uncultured Pseudonocardia sp. TaxID=211455 RepID=UPI00260AE3F1|nr:hypothetical protein [uncultured Pseudonocardia sp.]